MAAVMAAFSMSGAAHARSSCHTRACEARVAAKHARWSAHWCNRNQVCRYRVMQKRTIRPYLGWLYRTAACESGRRWHIATGNGFFGGLQFTVGSWRAVGGTGMPHLASPLEQMYRAVLLLRRSGAGNWPVCGH